MVITSSAVTLLFGDMTPPIESHMRENYGKNTVGPNEFTDFEKFEVEHPENTKTILATNSPNHPGDGITLRLTSHTTAVIHTSAGDMHRCELFPSRPQHPHHSEFEALAERAYSCRSSFNKSSSDPIRYTSQPSYRNSFGCTRVARHRRNISARELRAPVPT